VAVHQELGGPENIAYHSKIRAGGQRRHVPAGQPEPAGERAGGLPGGRRLI